VGSDLLLKREGIIEYGKEGTRVSYLNTMVWRLLDEKNRGQEENITKASGAS
jgi:hypothetical protein